ncbi:MAG TPA: hypothetical protein VF122_07265 [Caulobacteraceae bacterium]
MRAYLLLGVAALSLGACKLDRTPQAQDQAEMTAGAPFDILLAPAYADLPPAPQPVPVYYAPQPVAYDYWNDAYDMNQAYYNQPPSYFNYSGATPLVWTQPYQPQSQSLTDTLTNFAITRIVEALVGGGQREYYYQPGAQYPYFVRDPQYAYAIDDGRLVSVYDPYGRVLGEPVLMQQAPVVSRYLYRADNLYDAALAATLEPLTRDIWDTQRVVLVRDLDDNDGWRSTWIPGANRSPVAIQRLAEVRARKELRDEAHAAWKARLMASRPKGLKFVDLDDNDRPAVKIARVDRDDNRKVVRVDRDDDKRGGPKADREERKADRADEAKRQKRAELSQGQAKRAHADSNDRKGGGDDRKGGGKGNGGDKGGGKKD